MTRCAFRRRSEGMKRERRTATMNQIVVTAALLAMAALAMVPGGAEGARKAGVKKAVFGKLDGGTVVHLYTLTNARGLTAKIMTYGATLTELRVPDREGKFDDVVLGFDNLAQYLKGSP